MDNVTFTESMLPLTSSMTSADFARLGLEALLTCEECALYTRTSRQTIWRAIRTHRLQANRCGRALRVPLSELKAWIAANSAC